MGDGLRRGCAVRPHAGNGAGSSDDLGCRRGRACGPRLSNGADLFSTGAGHSANNGLPPAIGAVSTSTAGRPAGTTRGSFGITGAPGTTSESPHCPGVAYGTSCAWGGPEAVLAPFGLPWGLHGPVPWDTPSPSTSRGLRGRCTGRLPPCRRQPVTSLNCWSGNGASRVGWRGSPLVLGDLTVHRLGCSGGPFSSCETLGAWVWDHPSPTSSTTSLHRHGGRVAGRPWPGASTAARAVAALERWGLCWRVTPLTASGSGGSHAGSSVGIGRLTRRRWAGVHFPLLPLARSSLSLSR